MQETLTTLSRHDVRPEDELIQDLLAAGQFLRFVYVLDPQRVRAWDLGVDPRTVDVRCYGKFFDRAVGEIMRAVEVGGARST
jgi:hypothetical protein